MSDIDTLLWVESHRPKTLSDCVLPARLMKTFAGMKKSGVLQNMTLTGSAGIGKTTIAKALCNDLGIEYLLINASETGNIDTIRTLVRQYGSGMSFNGGLRAIILDEGDYLTPAAQGSLRGMIEELSANCRFIITANFMNRIIDPLLSRCPPIEFSFSDDEKIEALVQSDARIRSILASEGIELEASDEDAFSSFLMKHAPDMRTTLNILQKACAEGWLDWSLVNAKGDMYDMAGLIESLKTQNFDRIRDWVSENSDRDGATLRRYLYSNLEEHVKPESLPPVILTINEHDYREAFVADREINTMAMLLSIVGEVEFK